MGVNNIHVLIFSLNVFHVLALANNSHNKPNKCTNIKVTHFTHNLS